MPRTYNQSCLIAKTLDLLGERWTLLIVRDLLQGERRFQDLQGSLCGISPNILSARLKLLDEHGLVQRRMYSAHPPRCAYTLTDKGRALEEAIRALWAWGNRYLDPAAARACAQAAEALDATPAPPKLQPRRATVTVWKRRANSNDATLQATCGAQVVLRVRVSRCDVRAPEAQPSVAAALHAAPDCCDVRCNHAA